MTEVKRGRGRPRSVTTPANTDLALQAGLPASSAHRLLMTLQQHDFVDFDENTQFWQVGIEAFRVGNAYLSRTNFLEAARQPLRDLMEITGETANLAVMDKAEVVFVAQVETTNPIRAFFSAGTRALMHSSGVGKALLSQMPRPRIEALLHKAGLPRYTPKTLATAKALYADLETTAQRGWSFDQEERYEGMSCVGAAICNAKGDLIGGISVSGPSVRFDPLQVAVIGVKVKAAADQVTLTLGGKV